MASYVRILVRRDTTANWTANNPVLALGEIGADMTLHRLKVGNGLSTWTALPWSDEDIIDSLTSDRTDAALSANQGKALKTNITNLQTSVTNLQTTVNNISEGGSGNSTEITNIKNDIKDIQDKLDNFGTFGMGYTVDEFNAYGRPTKITFSDGVTATLTWQNGTILKNINSSDGETITINYNNDGAIIGRTVTKSS